MSAWLSLFRHRLRPWELAALQAWLERADPAIQAIGKRQLDLVVSAGRHIGGTEVYLRYDRSSQTDGDWPKFADFPREKQVADVRISINGQRVKCQIWVINGRIAMLEFSKLPPLFLRKAYVEILDVKTGPFPSDKKRDELAASLPQDYVDLVKAVGPTGPEEKNGIGILTLEQIYVVTIEGEQYWMLAEKPDVGMLGVPTDESDRVVRFLFYDGRPSLALSASFREALEKAGDVE